MWASNRTNPKTRGFTIIEVVLVLAIAGLIFLIVFLALPALQRSQRDTARKNSLSQIVAALHNFRANNQNQDICYDTATAPPTWCGNQTLAYNASYGTFINSYLEMEYRAPDEFADKATHFYAYLSTHPTPYSSDAWAVPALPPGMVVVQAGGSCDGGRLLFNPASKPPGLAVYMKTEVGPGFCQKL